jgi:hypothetical protein
MHSLRHISGWFGVVLVVLLACTGCTYAALQKLTAEERSEFHIYHKVMNAAQERAYLAKTTAAERTAYLAAIGLTQRFQALAPLDRDAVLGGIPRQGMSAEALRFLWGEPYTTAGDATRYAHWFYLGSSIALAEYGNQYSAGGNRVDVYLVDGHVVGWVDYTPSSPQRRRFL